MYYFVTGASGFIGSRLVKKLLARSDSTVYFLIRRASLAKVPDLLAGWGVDGTRAIAVVGDLQNGLSDISRQDVDLLTGKIDHFFHLAAVYDLKADAALQIQVNEQGTRVVVAFANAIRAGLLHHVSSIAAAGLYRGVFREDMFEEAENLTHPYFSTKHNAEKIVRCEAGVPFRIYRPGMVVGDSVSGVTAKADGPYYFFKLIQRIRQIVPAWMPMVGPEGGRINIVPVDYVVNAMDWIAHRAAPDGQCFHLTDPEPLRVGAVLDTLARAAHAPVISLKINAALLDFIPTSVRTALMALTPVQRIREAVLADLGIPAGMLQFINYPTRFDNRNACAALQGSGISCPGLPQYADRIWDYWERHLDPALQTDQTFEGRVRGKTVLVTGGSSGIGLALTHRLAGAGAKTIICGRSAEKLAAARSEIVARGFDVITCQVDLADRTAADEFVQSLLREHGTIDILVNSAGKSIRRSVEASYDRFHDFERLMQLNYFGALSLIMGLLPKMAEQKSGHIINISSIGVLTNAPRFSGYVASKAALEAFSRCAASEFSDVGVSFTSIHMPLVRTPMIAPTRLYDNVPALTPDEAAGLIAQAIMYRPACISTRLGRFGQVVHALMPRMAQIIMNTSFRMFPDNPENAGQPPALNADQSAMQQLLRGLHF